MPRPDYGIDAPDLVKGFFAVGVSALLASGLMIVFGPALWWIGILVALFAAVGADGLVMGSYMIYGSRVSKVRDCRNLLDQLIWHGNETVLDAGCGRGLMLVEAAKRIRDGHATGVDIWEQADQANNSAGAALNNAAIEGVKGRTTVTTADIRILPFADQSFDVVMTNWVVHNLPDAPDRTDALTEMARVLRPSGTLLLSDIANRDEYQNALAQLGFDSQQLIVSPVRDVVLGIVTFGSFRPFAIIARRLSDD